MLDPYSLICERLRTLLVEGAVQAWLLARGHPVSATYLSELHAAGEAAQSVFPEQASIPFLKSIPFSYVLLSAFENGRRVIDDGLEEEDAWRRLETGNWLIQADGGCLAFQTGVGSSGIEERQIVKYSANLETTHCAPRTYKNFCFLRSQGVSP